MSISLALNENNDLFADSSGNLALVSGTDATRQDCETVMRCQAGECVLNLQRGVPTAATIWDEWLPKQFEAAARAQLLTVPGVVSIQSFTLTRLGNVATYVAEILTIYSPTAIVITGSLTQ